RALASRTCSPWKFRWTAQAQQAPTRPTCNNRNTERPQAPRRTPRRAAAPLPGVIEVGLGSNVPLRGNDQFRLDVKAESRPLSPGEPTPNAEYRTATPEYVRAARMPMVKGREFTSADRRGNARVVVINQTLAKRLFGDKDPIG